MKPEDCSVDRGRFVVLAPNGKKIIQTGCFTIARNSTDMVEGAKCWRLSRYPFGKAVEVYP